MAETPHSLHYSFIDEVTAAEQGLMLGWKRGEGSTVISQPNLGMEVAWMLVKDENGNAKYDQIIRAERPGAVFLAIDPMQGRIGLQEMRRPQDQDQEALEREFPKITIGRLGGPSFEAPRGFAKPSETGEQTAIREAESEVRRRVRSCIRLGDICDNTSLSAHMTHVYYGEVNPDPNAVTDVPEDPLEKIVRRLQFFDLDEIRKLQKEKEPKLYCGYTIAAIGLLLLDERSQFRNVFFKQ